MQQLCFGFFAPEREVKFLVTVEADDIGEEADLCVGPVTVGSIDLAVDVAGVDEENFVGARRALFAFVQEPECAWQRDGVENIRADGDHHVNGVRFDELFSQLLLGGASVGGGVSHDEAGTAFFVERRIEKLNPEIIPVVRAWQAEGIAAVLADGVFEPILVHRVDIERRIGEDEVEVTGAIVFVVVVRVGLADVALKTVDG